uniref:Beta-caryophyllene/alpha-humulene synthase n=1 Tax=Artabotrys hexapetalus TaxID=225833 RepID=A0AA96Q4S8_ARTHX|nr:beta-caryophyllene/alpha-humulene synthase [Artabotrys hexapetalus]
MDLILTSSSRRSDSIANQPTVKKIGRKSANYQPSVWGDCFIAAPPEDMMTNIKSKERVEELKLEVKRLLRTVEDQPIQEMKLIDQVQRLGLAYHFEKEIDEVLHRVYKSHTNDDFDGTHDLDAVALRFRLLRQQGYNVSSDVFKKLKDKDGNFQHSLCTDVKGLLSLYEAAHLGTQGEEILDEAIAFTRKNLTAAAAAMADYDLELGFPLQTQVRRALEFPLHKGMPRLETRELISSYQQWEESHRCNVLLELAKLDFNMLQLLHRNELQQLSRWWRDLDFRRKLPFARDRLVECYFWILGVFFEPQFSFGRIVVTKLISIASILDDIYDVYGTLDELNSFTQLIQRWDVGAIDQLPEYMQVCFRALDDVVKETEETTTDEGRPYCAHFSKEAMKVLTRAYYLEAEWFSIGYVPKFDEYLETSNISSGYPMLAVQALVGLGDVASKEAFEWVLGLPQIVRSTSTIARLMDDIQTNKVEKERGDNASGVECYMKEHGATEEEACEALRGLISTAWKDINQACLSPTPFPKSVLMPSLNLARMMEVLYKNGDGYTNSSGLTQKRIASLLLHPFPL